MIIKFNLLIKLENYLIIFFIFLGFIEILGWICIFDYFYLYGLLLILIVYFFLICIIEIFKIKLFCFF